MDNIVEYHKKIKEIVPSCEIPSRPATPSEGGYHVATVVYGSYEDKDWQK